MRLLEKAPEARFQSALDVVWALEQVDSGSAGGPLVPRPSSDSTHMWRPRSVVWATASAFAALLLLTVWTLARVPSRDPRGPELTRFTWPLPSGMALGSAPMVSPDGRLIAFVGRSERSSQLYVRDRGSVDAVPIPVPKDRHIRSGHRIARRSASSPGNA